MSRSSIVADVGFQSRKPNRLRLLVVTKGAEQACFRVMSALVNVVLRRRSSPASSAFKPALVMLASSFIDRWLQLAYQLNVPSKPDWRGKLVAAGRRTAYQRAHQEYLPERGRSAGLA